MTYVLNILFYYIIYNYNVHISLYLGQLLYHDLDAYSVVFLHFMP